MRRGRLVLASPVTIGTGTWRVSRDSGNDRRYDALVTGDAGGVVGLGICDLCSVTIGTGQPRR